MQRERLAFVQFIHPGREQRQHRNGFCAWGKTSNPHGRKFMLNEAAFTRAGVEERGLVGFWCEWEGPSYVRDICSPREGDYPQAVHTLAYREPDSHEGLWDTDPFVFGKRFLYNGCQQHTGLSRKGGPSETFLRRLTVGSLILFGSAINRRFVLDTAFVVGSFIDYPNGSYDVLEGRVSAEYYSVGLHTQALIEPSVDSYRLYEGATFDQQIGGMYSFTPCRAASDGDVAFERPHIAIPRVMTQELTQGKKATDVSSVEQMRSLWLEVLRQVEAARCLPAHRIEFNPKRLG